MGWWIRAKWRELNSYVRELRRTTRQRQIWRDIRNKPITADSIEVLVGRSKLDILDIDADAMCLPGIELILLNFRLEDYERDKALFHELAHLHYGNQLNDVKDSLYRKANGAITEWLARRARANPEILRRAVFGFGLEPRAYDLASAIAFCPYLIDPRQLIFPFAQKYFDELRYTKMD